MNNLNFRLILLALPIIYIFVIFQFFIGSNMNVIDEMQYMFGILNGSKESAYPSNFFFFLQRNILFDENNVVLSSRCTNILFLIFGYIPILLISNKYLANKSDIFIISLFYFFGPFSFFTLNVMPEIIFSSFMFWIVYIYDRYRLNFYSISFTLPIIFVSLYFIKNHALFNFILFLSFLLLFEFLISRKNKYENLKKISIFIISTLVLKIIVDLYLFGTVNIFGGVYNSIVERNDIVINFVFFTNLIVSLVGNLLPILLLVPLYLNLNFKKNIFFINTHSLPLLSLFLLFGLIFITALFTTYISFTNSSELFNRVHDRYYSYIYILVLIASMSLKYNYFSKLSIFCFIFLGFLLSILFNKFYIVSYIDNPFSSSLFFNKFFYIFFIFLLFFKKIKFQYFFNLFIVIFVCMSFANMYKNFNSRTNDTIYDKAGKILCSSKYKNEVKFIYTDNIVAFGFFYYQCPGPYIFKDITSLKHPINEESLLITNSQGILNSLNLREFTKLDDNIYIMKGSFE